MISTSQFRSSFSVRAALIAALTLAVSRGNAEELILEGAVVTPLEVVALPARVAGVLSNIIVREGRPVVADEHLAEIDDSDARLAAQRAEILLAVARAEAGNKLRVEATAKGAEVARAELQRAVESVEKYKKSISQTELDHLRLKVEQTDLEYRQSQHELDVARLNANVKENEVDVARQTLDRHRIRAPIDGVVVELLRRRGEWVEPGMPVLRLLRMDRFRIEAFLAAERVTPGLLGAPVRFIPQQSTDDPVVSIDGRLSFISPEVNSVNNQVRIWAEVENVDHRLRPGLQGRLVILKQAETEPKNAPAKNAPTKVE